MYFRPELSTGSFLRSSSCNSLAGAGFLVLGSGYLLLVTGYSLLVTGFLVLITEFGFTDN